MKTSETPKVVTFKPKPHVLMQQIREICKHSDRVFFGKHARERLLQRDVTDREAIFILSIGEIVGEIDPGECDGEWKCKVVARRKGSQELGIVTIVQHQSRLFIKTVEWETK